MKKTIFPFLIAVVLVFSSCQKDSEEITDDENNGSASATVSSSDAQQTLEKAFQDMETDFSDMFNTEGMEIMNNFSQMDDPLAGGQLKSLTKSLKSAKLKSTSGESFDFNNYKGATFQWNHSTQMWDSIGNNESKMIVEFPSDSTKTTNDVKIVLSSFDVVYINNDTLPSSIYAKLSSIDGTTDYIILNFSAAYNADGIPTDLSVDLTVSPYAFSVGFTDNMTSITASAGITYNTSTTLFDIGGTVNFLDSNKDSVISIQNGFVTYRTIQVKGGIDIQAASTADDIAGVNSALDVAVYETNGLKLADIVLKEIQTDSVDVYLQYSDGTSEPASNYIDPLVQSIEADAEALNNFFNSDTATAQY